MVPRLNIFCRVHWNDTNQYQW